MQLSFLLILASLSEGLSQNRNPENGFVLVSSHKTMQSRQDQICQHVRDEIVQLSGRHGSKTAINMQGQLDTFIKRGCLKSESIPAIERVLIAKLDEQQK